MLVLSSLQATPPRDELLHSPRYADARAPHFESFTPESLRDALRVGSRRSYATLGFNDPAVTVRLPASTNSIDSVVTFDTPKLTDASGHAVAFELEQGIFDFDTSSTEIRMTKAKDFAHAIGKLTVKYPIAVTTLTLKKGDAAIEGPFVTLKESAFTLPQAAPFSRIFPVRAYDASGRQLERVESSSTTSGATTYAFWGQIASVQIDRVDKWAEVGIDYDLPPAPRLAAKDKGQEPSLEERFKRMDSPGGKVTKTLVTQKTAAQHAESADAEDAPVTADAARAELKEQRVSTQPDMLAMYAGKGDKEVVKLLLAAGVPINAVGNTGDSALIRATRQNRRSVASMLIKAGADVNQRDAIGGTALLYASGKCNWTSIVEALLGRGAKTSPKTAAGNDAIQEATTHHCAENLKAIKEK
jgi:hypothetical protein